MFSAVEDFERFFWKMFWFSGKCLENFAKIHKSRFWSFKSRFWGFKSRFWGFKPRFGDLSRGF